jgi:starch-binding outer membrane protein, SusD/RagB family
MTHHYNYLSKALLVCLVALGLSCSKDFLDTTPNDLLTEKMILEDKEAFNTHLAYLYTQMPFDDFTPWLSRSTDEMVNSAQDQSSSINVNLEWWQPGYTLIRALNNMIEKLPAAPVFAEAEKAQVLGELKFMRAYTYFSLVQRYGGVPLISQVQSFPASGDPSELQAPRNKEAEVFGFIEKEMTDAIAVMATAPTEYRLNKWSALAFKSRAMLYAAAIARYSEVQLDGLVGIPAAEANHYWESAREAAKQVIASGQYELYNKEADKVANYHKLFFDESAGNKERIFVKAYVWPDRGHSFDRESAPFNHRSGEGYGGRYCPLFDMVESYEYVNDRDGTLKLNRPDGTPISYANPTDLFAGKDPRFFASVLFPGSPWKGTTLKIYAKVIEGGVEKAGNGADGITQPEATSTGFYLSKWADPAPPRPINGSSSEVDRMSIRYAEVLLNCAEAELELNNEPEARKYVNLIRQRAGIQELTGALTQEDYRHERKIELAYEGNRYWDMKRWRIYHQEVFNSDAHALWPVYNKDTQAYLFRKQKLPTDKFTRTFTPNMYYAIISNGIRDTNPLLVQNPGY